MLREVILVHYRAQKESTTPDTRTQFPFLSELHNQNQLIGVLSLPNITYVLVQI